MSTLYKNAPNKPRTTTGRGGLLFVLFLLLGIGVGFGQGTIEVSQAAGSGAEDTGGNLPALFVAGAVVSATTVTVTDAGTGTAISGDDYDFTSPQLVNIPAGSYDGTAGTAVPIPTLSITGDLDVEGDETINLTLGTA